MPCQLFAQKCSNCQEITKISKCSGPPPPPRTFCHWYYIHRDILFLQHVIQTIASGFNFAFWWYGALSEDQEKSLMNLSKLSCGFKVWKLVKAFSGCARINMTLKKDSYRNLEFGALLQHLGYPVSKPCTKVPIRGPLHKTFTRELMKNSGKIWKLW